MVNSRYSTTLLGLGELGLCRMVMGAKEAGSEFTLATEDGQMLIANWKKLKTKGEDKDDDGVVDGSVSSTFIKWIGRDHFRPCVAVSLRRVMSSHALCLRSTVFTERAPTLQLARSPFFSDVLLSVGQHSFNIWKDGIKSPLFTSPMASATFTSASWSPTRPAVLVVAKSNGTLDFWDFSDQSHKAALTVPVTSGAISAIQCESEAYVGDGTKVTCFIHTHRSATNRPNQQSLTTKLGRRRRAGKRPRAGDPAQHAQDAQQRAAHDGQLSRSGGEEGRLRPGEKSVL